MNGRIHGELRSPIVSTEDELRRLVHSLDGRERYSLILWALPAGTPFDLVNLDLWPQEYIQAAGSGDSMVTEIRKTVDGSPRQFAVGHIITDSDPQGSASVSVHWDDSATLACPNEIFEANEVADLFIAYYKYGSVPGRYSLRLLTL